MYKLPKSAIGNWDRWQDNLYFPRVIDISCPHCRKELVTFTTSERWNNNRFFWFSTSACPACKETVLFWMFIRGPRNNPDSAKEATDIYMDPDPVPTIGYDKRIDEISPKFGIIYRQATQAEMLGLAELVGIGYRKAIEFLLKDWAISEHPDERDKIAKMNLMDCVKNYIQDPSLKNGFARVVWLGNDETHYERVWKDKDIDDLKRLLKASLHKLNCELELKSLPETMPYTKK